MSTNQQKEELHKTIWSIADELRGAVGGWEFKAYVLGTLFYRFISENITDYINNLQKEAGVEDFDYAQMADEEAEGARYQIVQEKGFFILPSQLFCNVCARCEDDDNLNMTLSNIFREIEGSAIGTESEDDMKGLFSDFNVDSTQLGGDVKTRNKLISKVLLKVRDMNLGDFQDNKIDAFGDAYEFLMTMYASSAGKSGGEFFTPQEVSELLARITAADGHEIRSVYDPACGSGSLLLKFSKTIGRDNPMLKYYGQEINPTTYNLCRINMFLHNINYDNFDIQLGDTLINPQHRDLEPFDAIVSNPPYSTQWEGSKNPLLINDDRYSGPGVLAPDKTADLAFTLHMLASLSESGTAAIVEFPGVLYRGGKEQAIRRWLVENNYVDTIIQLPANLFFGVGIATCIIVLRKSARPDNRILFIDASKEFVKNGNKNRLASEYQDHIFQVFAERREEEYFSRLVAIDEVLKNDANLSVSSYVEQEDTREVIDIEAVNSHLRELIEEGNALNVRIEEIINKQYEYYRDQLLDLEGKEGVEWKTLGEVCVKNKNIRWKNLMLEDIYKYIDLTSVNIETHKIEGVSDIDKSNAPSRAQQIVEEGDVLLGTTRPTLKRFCQIPIEFNNQICSTGFCVFRANKIDVLSRWIYHNIGCSKFWDYCEMKQQGAGYPCLSNSDAFAYIIPIPPKQEQSRIVSILDQFESSIANLEAQLKEREKQYEYYRNQLLTFE